MQPLFLGMHTFARRPTRFPVREIGQPFSRTDLLAVNFIGTVIKGNNRVQPIPARGGKPSGAVNWTVLQRMGKKHLVSLSFFNPFLTLSSPG